MYRFAGEEEWKEFPGESWGLNNKEDVISSMEVGRAYVVEYKVMEVSNA